MKTKGKRNLRLKYLLIVLLLTAILFGSSTYAWFTTNKTVTVSSIEVKVISVEGIQISANGVTNWGASIDKTALTTASYQNATDKINTFPVTVEPVSTALGFNETTQTLEMFYGLVQADNNVFKLTATQNDPDRKYGNTLGNTSDTKYVVFDMYLKTSSPIENGKLKVAYDSGVSSTNPGAENAARVAFIKLGTVEDGSADTAIQGLNDADITDVLLWEQNATDHTPAAESYASSTYGSANGMDNITNTAVPTLGVAEEITTGIPLANTQTASSTFVELTPIEINAEGRTGYAYTRTTSQRNAVTGALEQTSNIPFFDLTAGITKIRVYMWMEGQDPDCENNASGATTYFNLKFTIDETIHP